jgi:hypothetical protein
VEELDVEELEEEELDDELELDPLDEEVDEAETLVVPLELLLLLPDDEPEVLDEPES